MKQQLAQISFKIARLFRKIGKYLNRQAPARQAILDRWKIENNQASLRYKYDLSPQSVVFDLGGYEGEWAAEMAARYGCQVEVFEPYLPYAANIAKRFENNPKINVHAFGLDRKYERLHIKVDADSTSVFKAEKGENTVEVELRSAKEFLEKGNFEQIGVMKINIEGGEFALLEHLIETGWVTKIRNFQIQFHHFVPNARQRMEAIQKELAKTHEVTYQYDFLWENWKLR